MQNIACSAIGLKLTYQRYNKSFEKIFKGYLERSSWQYDSILKHRDERLRHFVEHAVSNTDYYSTLFSKLKIKSHDIQTITDLSQLPILTKDEVKKNYQQLILK